MDSESKKELIRLYELAEYSTAATNFYDRVYKYIKFINENEFLTDLLKKDNADWHIYDIERLDTRPKQVEGESWSKHFFKEMRHMNSGDSYFLSHYFLTLAVDIHDFYDFHYREGREYEELDIMMNGRKYKLLKNKILDFFQPRDLFPDQTKRNNELYIDNFNRWKTFLKSFHELLIQRIDKAKKRGQSPFIL